VILAQFYRWSSRFILTNRRVILKNDILRQRSTEFPLRSVESVTWSSGSGPAIQLRDGNSLRFWGKPGFHQAGSEA
jgi:hypothetical protein